ncbi:adult-specific rigid cuticular protein 15.5-like [Argiope bruennichi]|uniref:adult-specific rigid cuticular protein 15.5-like n=1 Tax=Argiope bruennichi TaxID=94029 RepID=UPI00249530F9|nr:adult-specific rigid cuticular protein 15.5-like [Argiope bruennichi]
MFAKVLIFCAALAAAHGSALFAAPLVNTGVSVESRQQDSLGNYAYAYDIKDGLSGSVNSKAEVGRAVAVTAPVVAAPLAYAAPAIAAPLTYAAHAVAAPVAYGGVLGHAGVLGLRYGVGLGHGAPLGLGYGAGILAAGHGKVLL